MTRLLGRRTLSLKKPDEQADHEADYQAEREDERNAAVTDAPAPRKPSTRRRRAPNAAVAEPREPRRAPAPTNGAGGDTAPSESKEAKPSRRRSTSRRSAPEPTPDNPLLAAMQRQTALLERQAELIEQQQHSLTRLTDAMLGAKRGGIHTQGAQIEVSPRLAVFVDVPNILYAAEATNVELNWGKVADFLSEGRTLVRAIAYAPISDDPNERTENERFVVPFLEHGYRIATKPLKRFRGGSVKANFDVELAIDVLTMADRVDVIVLVSGDGDFRRLVEIVGSRGVRVEVMAFGQSTSQDLRVVADRYIDIAGYIPELTGR